MTSDVVILAGGLGTRLKHLLNGIPKPMAPVDGKPFLEYIFRYLQKQGAQRAILSTGYRSEHISDYFKNEFCGIEIAYSHEYEPLGTGGAIAKALQLVSSPLAFVLNGDTFFDTNLNAMLGSHLQKKASVSIAIKEMQKFDRYGTIRIKGNRITAFVEKQPTELGFINGGIYVLPSNLFVENPMPHKFSFESDFLEKATEQMHLSPFLSEGYFIDIGVPDDYDRANLEFGSLPNFAT